MTSAEVWATIALLALCALGFFVIAHARSQLIIANAWKVWAGFDERYDARVSDALAKYKQMVDQRNPGMKPQVQSAQTQSEIDKALSRIVPGFRPEQVATGVAEQPDSEEEIAVTE